LGNQKRGFDTMLYLFYSIALSLHRTSKSKLPRIAPTSWFFPLLWIATAVLGGASAPAYGQNQVTLELVDTQTSEPIAARIQFTKSAKKLQLDRKPLSAGETWLAEGSLAIQPAPGDYEFLVERGPEFHTIRGGFTIERGSRDTVLIEVPRSIDMHDEGWYSGDLSSELDAEQLGRWQIADAIDMVVHASNPSPPKNPPPKNPSQSKNKNKQIDAPKLGGPKEVGYRWSGSSLEYRDSTLGLALHRLPTDHELSGSSFPSPAPTDPYEALEAIDEEPHALAEITQLLAADLPIVFAHPRIRCARVLNLANRPQRDAVLELDRNQDDDLFAKLSIDLGKSRWQLPVLAPFPHRDQIRFRSPRSAGLMSEAIYWLALDAGLRLPPSAASGFGSGSTHLGYNRVYAYCDSEPTPDSWWRSIARGESFITNGPLLRVKINGLLPGSVQVGYQGEPIPLSIDVSLSVRDPVEYVDIIFNGQTLYNAKLEDHYRKGEFPPLEIHQSGWLVVRVVTEQENGYRLATTAPFYFEFDGQKRTDRKAVEFFQQWLARIESFRGEGSKTSQARDRAIQQAKEFWERRWNESK
jgi:hypothetical protein